MTLLEIFKDFMLNNKHSFSECTYNTYKYTFIAWRDKLGINIKKEINEFTPKVAQHLALRIKDQDNAPMTINLQLSLMRSILKYHQQVTGKPTNWELINNVKVRRKDIETVDEEECLHIIREAQDTLSMPAVCIATMLLSGTRVSEAINLKLTDVDIEDKSILIRNGKGGKKRSTFMLDPLADILRAYIHQLPKSAEYLFTSKRTQKPVSRIYIFQQCQALFLDMNIHPHLLRHTYATLLAKKDLDVFTLQKILGHSNLSTTQLYLHPSHQDLKTSFSRALATNGSPF